MTEMLDTSALDLLTLVSTGPVRAQDPRMNPLAAIDLMDAGLVKIDTGSAAVTITDRGLAALKDIGAERKLAS